MNGRHPLPRSSEHRARPPQRWLAIAACSAGLLVVAATGFGAWQLTHRNGSPIPSTRPPRELLSTSAPAPVATCTPDPTLAQPPQPAPAGIAFAAATFLADQRVVPNAVSVSIWVDGYGEVVAHDPDRLLAPASNQKLLTAMAALAVLGPDTRLTTELVVTSGGDLVVRGGGDPTLTRLGPHSLATLAAQTRMSGLAQVPGALLVDESADDGARRALGWQDWQIPTYTGPLSAFMVDDNRWRRDAGFLTDPALANAELLRVALAASGVTIGGNTGYGATGEDARVVASLQSAPVAQLVNEMLQTSDNQTADLLLKQSGAAASGVGSLAAGGAAARAALERLCVEVTGVDDDGSGLSRANARSAREWRILLQATRSASWWPIMFEALPIAGRSGTLASRFHGTAAEGNVRAKTGTIIGGAALSGYGTTAGGRTFIFSIIVNGPGAEGSAGAIDTLVAAIAQQPG